MKAIRTKYHGATHSGGSRLSAEAEGVGRIYISYDYALDSTEKHAKACRTLADKYQWNGKLIGGELTDGSMAWVFESTASAKA